MTVGTWGQPDFEAQSGTQYKTNLDNCLAVAERLDRIFAPHEQSTPNMTVRLDPGYIFVGTTLTEKAAQNTTTITAPTSNPRIDRVVVDQSTGAVSVVTGTESGSPSPPAIPEDKWPICQVYLYTSTTQITNGLITDERAFGVAVPSSNNSGYNSYTTSSTWYKPDNIQYVIFKIIGGGGGGGRAYAGTTGGGGGGGGSAMTMILAASLVGASVAVTVGTGGTGGTDPDTTGGAGGSSSFGSFGTVGGGSGGRGGNYGGDAGGGGPGGVVAGTSLWALLFAHDGHDGNDHSGATGGTGGDSGMQIGRGGPAGGSGLNYGGGGGGGSNTGNGGAGAGGVCAVFYW